MQNRPHLHPKYFIGPALRQSIWSGVWAYSLLAFGVPEAQRQLGLPPVSALNELNLSTSLFTGLITGVTEFYRSIKEACRKEGIHYHVYRYVIMNSPQKVNEYIESHYERIDSATWTGEFELAENWAKDMLVMAELNYSPLKIEKALWQRLSRIFYATKQIDKAIHAAEKAYEIDKSRDQLLRLHGLTVDRPEQHKRYQQKITALLHHYTHTNTLRLLDELNKTRPREVVRSGANFIQKARKCSQQRPEEALLHLKAAGANLVLDARSYLLQGDLYMKTRAWAQALQSYDNAMAQIAWDPELSPLFLPAVYLKRAQCYLDINNRELADVEFTRLFQLGNVRSVFDKATLQKGVQLFCSDTNTAADLLSRIGLLLEQHAHVKAHRLCLFAIWQFENDLMEAEDRVIKQLYQHRQQLCLEIPLLIANSHKLTLPPLRYFASNRERLDYIEACSKRYAEYGKKAENNGDDANALQFYNMGIFTELLPLFRQLEDTRNRTDFYSILKYCAMQSKPSVSNFYDQLLQTVILSDDELKKTLETTPVLSSSFQKRAKAL